MVAVVKSRTLLKIIELYTYIMGEFYTVGLYLTKTLKDYMIVAHVLSNAYENNFSFSHLRCSLGGVLWKIDYLEVIRILFLETNSFSNLFSCILIGR